MASQHVLAFTRSWLEDLIGEVDAPQGMALAILLALAVIVYFLARLILTFVIGNLLKKTTSFGDDPLLQKKGLFLWLALLAPGVVLYLAAEPIVGEPLSLVLLIRQGATLYMVIVGYLAMASLLNGGLAIYRKFPVSREIPLRSFVQVAKLILFLITAIILLSLLLGRSPLYFLGGLGAITAVLLLVFKDTILGFVAGIQLAANRMVARGDWVEMPKYGADGSVIEIALTTVKVKNWDNTVTTVPTYALISDSFKNWRGMEESPGRRIKRAIRIDINSIRFCEESLLSELRKIALLSDYLQRREREIEEANRKHDAKHPANDRRLTNIGTFRAYAKAYVENYPMINQDLTVLVRQLAAGENGLPLEIYVFSKDKNWVNYEAVQSDIFDHLFAILPFFKLRPFQRGSDFPAG